MEGREWRGVGGVAYARLMVGGLLGGLDHFRRLRGRINALVGGCDVRSAWKQGSGGLWLLDVGKREGEAERGWFRTASG